MRALRILTLFGILMTSVPSVASAEWYFTPFLGFTFKGETSIFDPRSAADNRHWTLGGAVTLLGSGPLGVEALIVYTPGFFEGEAEASPANVIPPEVSNSRSLAIMGNAVLAMPQARNGYGLRPFVSGGIGLLHTSATDSLALVPVRTNLFGYNIGGGAVGMFTDRTGMRFDLRYFGTLREIDDREIAIFPVYLKYWTATVGVAFRY